MNPEPGPGPDRVLRVDAAADHGGAPLGEERRAALAGPRARAGDEGDLARGALSEPGIGHVVLLAP
ncbi:hypothetical protein [Streptomyces sp. NPDC056660]|uniref:hypothetical protein n=1 Tax=Streptomyces sp. NPDC056660 TaxID=3345897 RepID=UPI0036B7636F